MDTGFTRIELRFEHMELEQADYYQSAMNEAVKKFEQSNSARI
jgi:hypothetical protein